MLNRDKIDYYSRYKDIKACRDISSKQIICLLKGIFSRIGHPVSITSDNGKQFISAEFKTYCHEYDIKLFNSIPYWPQQNGGVERQNRDIIKRLKICQVERKSWKEASTEYLTMYNSTPHRVTRETQAELFFQRKFRDKIPMIDIAEQCFGDMDVRDKDKEQKQKGREYTDKRRRAREVDIQVGGKVYVKNVYKR
ncbi:MAG: transposase family protein [Nitrososphaeraceae archaeon]|nr:transposase family protein [Nitrososphaeraceae archaeon]